MVPSTGPRRQPARKELDRLRLRLEVTENRLERLHTTVRALARESNCSIAGPCDRCDRSYLLIKHGQFVCPHCGYQE